MKNVRSDYNRDDFYFHRQDPFKYGYWDDEVTKSKRSEIVWNVVGSIVLCMVLVGLCFI